MSKIWRACGARVVIQKKSSTCFHTKTVENNRSSRSSEQSFLHFDAFSGHLAPMNPLKISARRGLPWCSPHIAAIRCVAPHFHNNSTFNWGGGLSLRGTRGLGWFFEKLQKEEMSLYLVPTSCSRKVKGKGTFMCAQARMNIHWNSVQSHAVFHLCSPTLSPRNVKPKC